MLGLGWAIVALLGNLFCLHYIRSVVFSLIECVVYCLKISYLIMSCSMTKTNKMTCVPCEDSAWASTQSDQILRYALNRKPRTQRFFMRTAKTDQTGRMPRLIWVFAGCRSHFIGFIVLQLICCEVTHSSAQDKMSHIMRKPVYSICEQQRRRSACASAQSDQRLCCSLLR